MRVFISWSGTYSREVANLLYSWLPQALQFVDPFTSDKSIKKGSDWFSEIAAELGGAEFGIICLTPSNLDSKWIHFEAGAISNNFALSRTSALLLGLEPEDVSPPLSRFLHTLPTREDMLQLVETLNGHTTEGSLSADQLRTSFNKWWPDFEERLKAIDSTEDILESQEESQRTEREMLAELLQLTRGLSSRVEGSRRGITMPMKRRDIKINEAKGTGYAEITWSGHQRHCEGVAYFEGDEEVGKAHDAFDAGEARYEGVVYNEGEATIESFPIIITNLTTRGGGAHARFTAQGNPYAD